MIYGFSGIPAFFSWLVYYFKLCLCWRDVYNMSSIISTLSLRFVLMWSYHHSSLWIHVVFIHIFKVYFHGINILRPRQNGHHLPDDIFRCIFLNENVWIPIKIKLKFVPSGPINNIPALVQIMAWRRSGDKPLSEPVMVSLLTHICITRPQWNLISLSLSASMS